MLTQSLFFVLMTVTSYLNIFFRPNRTILLYAIFTAITSAKEHFTSLLLPNSVLCKRQRLERIKKVGAIRPYYIS